MGKRIRSNNILIGVYDPDHDNYQGVIELLDVLFSPKSTKEKKLEFLRSRLGIELPSNLEQEVHEMSILSEIIEKFGETKGKAEGKTELLNWIVAIKGLMRDGKCASIDEAMDSLNISDESDRNFCRTALA